MRIAILSLAASGLFAQSAFEVASVRPHRGPEIRTGPLTISGTLIRLEGYTVFGLVLDAFNVRDFQLAVSSAASEEDVSGTTYDILARAPGERTPGVDDVRAMLRALLADRFRLAVHHETKEMPVYSLVTAGNRSDGLKPSAAVGICSVARQNPEQTFSSCDMERLADALGYLIRDRPVINDTGLTGTYDFQLAVSDDVSPFTAVRKLGLKLTTQRSKVDVITIDHLEKPTGN